jgi:multidrug resistance efflux pump
MLIILSLYLLVVWLVFSKLRLLKWGWGTGSVTVFVGALIIAVFLAMFNYLTPSGSLTVISRVVEVTPNVSGQVVSIPVKANVRVKTGATLILIEQAPFQAKVKQLEASLAQARQQAKQLVSDYQQATANVEGLAAQLAYNRKRMEDMEKLTGEQAQTVFKMQDTQVQFETVQYQLQAAKAAQITAKLAMDSEIGGVNTSVAQIEAQLENARWELEQTVVRAPSNGVVTALALAVGDRALQAHPALSFIVTDDITLVGMFAPNGFGTIKPDAAVKIVFDSHPGQIFHAKVVEIPEGVGQGQLAVSGMLARVGSIGGAKAYPAVISIPDDMDRGQLKVGMPGTATVFAEKAGVIGLLMSIIVWISSYTAYL